MKKVTSIVLALTMLLLFTLISSCENKTYPTENNQISARESLYRIGTETDPCVTFTRTLWAGQNIEVGEIIIEEDGLGNITVTYSLTKPGWCITETHLHVATLAKDIPQTKQGNLIPGQFKYKMKHDCVTEYISDPIPIPGTDECADGADFYVAAHAVVEKVTAFTEAPYTGDNIVDFYQGRRSNGSLVNPGRSHPEAVLTCELDPTYTSEGTWFTLGYGGTWNDVTYGDGWIVIEFAPPVTGGEGPDLMITEVSPPDYPGVEKALVYGSNNGKNWVYIGQVDNSANYVGNWNNTTELEFPEGLKYARYIKLVDNSVITDPETRPKYSGPLDAYDIRCVQALNDYIEEETAWGEGDKLGKNWSMVMGYDICCEEEDPCDEWIIYGSNLGTTGEAPDGIYAVDLNARSRTLVYNPGAIDGSQNYPNANAYDPGDNRIYFGTSDGRLYYHEITSGVGTHVLVATGFGNMACGAWYNGKYYYVKNGTNELYEVTIAGGSTTRSLIGTVPTRNGYGDIVFDPHNPGRFVGSAGSNAYWYAYDINTHTSWTLQNGGLGNHKQLAYGSDGTLYGVDAISGHFWTVEYWISGTPGVTLTSYWESGLPFTDLASGPQCQ